MEQNEFQNTPETRVPEVFCVEYLKNERSGYAFIESTIQVSEERARIYVLKSKNHNNQYFRIINNRQYVLDHQTTWRIHLSKKSSGRITREMRWRNTGEALRYNNIDYPILRIPNSLLIIPAIPDNSFIPIRENTPLTQINHIEENKIQITKIPQHAIRALLRDAAMQEEVCPITGEDIDITNGAVTSCFHIFDNSAIATWMNMPNSQDKCPVCNIKCIVYNLDENPPGLIPIPQGT